VSIDETTPFDAVIAAANEVLVDAERTQRMVDTLRASMAAMVHVRYAWNELAKDAGAVAPVPLEIAQWHLCQVHYRAVAAWSGGGA